MLSTLAKFVRRSVDVFGVFGVPIWRKKYGMRPRMRLGRMVIHKVLDILGP